MDDEEARLMLPSPEPPAQPPHVFPDGAETRSNVKAVGLGGFDALFARHHAELRAHMEQLLAAARGDESPASVGRWTPLQLPPSSAWTGPLQPKPVQHAGFLDPAAPECIGMVVYGGQRRTASQPLAPRAPSDIQATDLGLDFAAAAAPEAEKAVEKVAVPVSETHAANMQTGQEGGLDKEESRASVSVSKGWTAHEMTSATGTRMSAAERLLHSPTFDGIIGVLIILNALFVGLDVEYCARELVEVPAPFFLGCLYFFCVLFAMELFLRIFVLRSAFYLGKERSWNLFDTITVILNIGEVVMLSSWPQGRPILLISRLMRIVRIVRVVRIFRVMVQLKLMLLSIMSTMRSLFWSLVLMVLFAYLCSVCLTQAATAHLVDHARSGEADPIYIEELRSNWGSLTKTGYTLFKSVMGGVSWGEPLRSLLKLHWIYFFVFVIYISFTLFAFFNVMTGFFCENALELANEDKEMVIQEQLKNKAKYVEEFQRLFSSIDEDGSGELSYAEFSDNLESEELKAYFQHLNLDIDRAHDIFRLLDKDGSGTITVLEFVEGCLQLRGPATKIDTATAAFEVVKVQKSLDRLLASLGICTDRPSARSGSRPSARSNEGSLKKTFV